jgi:hypothetical protein
LDGQPPLPIETKISQEGKTMTTNFKNFTALRNRRVLKAAQAERTARLEKARAEMRAIVATGVCPDCGRKLRNNLALAGWWQCSQFGAVGFRADAASPSCDFQGFTS